MSATPSRLPRDAATPAHPAFAPTLPFELEATAQERSAADANDGWHDTQPGDEFDTVPGALTASAAQPVAPLSHARAVSSTSAVSAATAAAARPLDPSDPASGNFREALGGLQVRELVNEELFQRLFGPVG